MASTTTTVAAATVATVPAPTIVVGHQYHHYNSERYVYVGKDQDSRQPEFIDYGKVAERNARAAAAHAQDS